MKSPEFVFPSSDTAQYLVPNPERKNIILIISTTPEIQSKPIRHGQFSLHGILKSYISRKKNLISEMFVLFLFECPFSIKSNQNSQRKFEICDHELSIPVRNCRFFQFFVSLKELSSQTFRQRCVKTVNHPFGLSIFGKRLIQHLFHSGLRLSYNFCLSSFV